MWYRGNRVECPCCGQRFRRFAPHRGRNNSLCPNCGSAERQRVLWLFLQRETDLLSRGQRVLHFAPEQAIAPRLAGLPHLDYVSGDLTPGAAMEVMDVTAIPRPDSTFDVVL